MLYQSTCVGLGYGLYGGAISWDHATAETIQSASTRLMIRHTPPGPGLFARVPIDYGFRPRLRGRLTLRGLALRRNPWTFGVSVSHTHLATHVSILTSDTSIGPRGSDFSGIRNAPLPLRGQMPGISGQRTGIRNQGSKTGISRF